MSAADLVVRFDHHPPRTDGEATEHANWRQLCLEAASYAEANIPKGRELSLALTKLEEAMMWGNAGIARARAREPGGAS